MSSNINIFPLKYYTQSGLLKPPLFFYASLLFLARTWALLVISIVSRQTGEQFLALFYPSRVHFYGGLIAGLIALLLFFLAGQNHHKHLWLGKLWQKGNTFLLLSIVFDLIMQLYFLWLARFQYSLEASLQLVFIVWILLFAVRSKHLRLSFKT